MTGPLQYVQDGPAGGRVDEETDMAWIAEKPLPTASMGLAAAVCDAPSSELGQWVYAIGGSHGNLSAAVAGYDTVGQTWSARPSMPTARTGIAAAISPGRIHVLGGFGVSASLTTHEVYEPANDSWSTAAPLPTPRGALAAVTGPDGLIYAIGGYDGNAAVATVDAYDPAHDKWTSKAPLNSPRTWHAAVVGHDGLIYAIGGGTPTILNSMEVFNVKTNTWTSSPVTLPAATCGLAAAVDPNGLIYAIGGDSVVGNTPTTTANVYSYNPAAPGWTSVPALSSARAALAAVTGPDGLIYALGGADSSGNSFTTVEAFTTDKCYPIEHKIAVVQRSILIEVASIAELPPNAKPGAEKQLANLEAELKNLQLELKICRFG
jgi:N-acetylneuraminic acid mutarotase